MSEEKDNVEVPFMTYEGSDFHANLYRNADVKSVFERLAPEHFGEEFVEQRATWKDWATSDPDPRKPDVLVATGRKFVLAGPEETTWTDDGQFVLVCSPETFEFFLLREVV